MGNEHAFSSLYRQFAPRVYSFCSFRVAEEADAEDLTQQTFMKAMEALPRYQDRGLPFAAWLFRIARNVVIDFERGRRTDLDLDDVMNQGADLVADTDASGADDRDALIGAIRELTRAQRDVLAYRFFADLSARETGLLMGRNEASVRTLQARAIGALRRRLATELAEPALSAEPQMDRRRPAKQQGAVYVLNAAGQRA
jgi:RNA polymerase sigma-70 factor (ECF subfamily)